MPKANEIAQLQVFYSRAGVEEGQQIALGKPFAHDECPRYLVELGRVMRLLPPPPARILDLGVGMGWTTVFLAKRGYDVVGQDICADAIVLARRLRDEYKAGTAEFVVQDYESMNFREEFDAAVFYDALHHAEDERAVLASVYKALKPGAPCITVEPGDGHSTSEATKDYIAEYGVTEKDMPPRHIIAVGREVGFRSFRVHQRDLDPYPNVVSSSDDAPPRNEPEPSGGRIRVAMRFAKKAARAILKGTCTEDHEFLYGWKRPVPPPELRESSIVWMAK